jgi:hypothetical protein
MWDTKEIMAALPAITRAGKIDAQTLVTPTGEHAIVIYRLRREWRRLEVALRLTVYTIIAFTAVVGAVGYVRTRAPESALMLAWSAGVTLMLAWNWLQKDNG